MSDQPPVSRHHIWRITKRTLSKSWDDSIFSESAQAAFWSALSLPPLLLGMLGSLAYIAPLFGPETLPMIEEQLINTANSFFSQECRERDHRADHPRHRQGRPRRGGLTGVCHLAVGRVVSRFGVRRLDHRGARSDAVAAPGAPALLRARAVRGDVGVGDRDRALHRAGPAEDRRAHSRELGQRPAVRLLPGALRWSARVRSHSCTGCRCPNRCRRTGW